MALTFSNNEGIEFSREGNTWVWWCQIVIGSDTYNIVDSDAPRLGYDALLQSVTSGRHSLNLVDYTSSYDGARISVEKSFWAFLASTYRLQEAVVHLYLGTVNMTSTEFRRTFTGSIKDYVTSGLGAEVRLQDPRSKLANTTINPLDYAFGKHPADVIGLVWADLLNSGEFTAPFLGTTADGWGGSDFGHIIANAWGNGVEQDDTETNESFFEYPPGFITQPAEELNANEFVDEMAAMIQAVVVGNGPLRLLPIRANDAVVATLTEDSCRFESENTLENVYNRVEVEFGTRLDGRKHVLQVTSGLQTVAGIKSDAVRTLPRKTFRFVDAFTRTSAGSLLASSTTIGDPNVLNGAYMAGFSGISSAENDVNALPAGGSGNSYATDYHLDVLDGRIAVIAVATDVRTDLSPITDTITSSISVDLIDQPAEFILVSGWQPHVDLGAGSTDTTMGINNNLGTPAATGINEGQIQARGAYGSLERSWPNQLFIPESPKVQVLPRVYYADVTVPMIWAIAQITRFEEGAPVIKAYTTGEHMNLEIGDVVDVQSRQISFFGYETLDTTSTDDAFRVVAIRINPESGKGIVELTLMFERDGLSDGATDRYNLIREGQRVFPDDATNGQSSPTAIVESNPEPIAPDSIGSAGTSLNGLAEGSDEIYSNKRVSLPQGGSMVVDVDVTMSINTSATTGAASETTRSL